MPDTKNIAITPQGKELLRQIEDYIKTLNQDSHENREYEINQTLDAKVRLLLVNLQLSVRDDAAIILSYLYQQHLGYTVWRIAKRITIQTTSSPGYLIPIRVSGNPSLNPGGPQQPGWYTHYTVDTELTPELDCIFVAKKRD